MLGMLPALAFFALLVGFTARAARGLGPFWELVFLNFLAAVGAVMIVEGEELAFFGLVTASVAVALGGIWGIERMTETSGRDNGPQ